MSLHCIVNVLFYMHNEMQWQKLALIQEGPYPLKTKPGTTTRFTYGD